jgi:GGDEF domain-containing protein
VLVCAWAWQLPTEVVVLATATIVLAAVRLVFVAREVRALVVTRSESVVDELTGLPNQRAIFEELELAGFRELTDTLGHEAAEAVLRPVAERLGPVVPGCSGG